MSLRWTLTVLVILAVVAIALMGDALPAQAQVLEYDAVDAPIVDHDTEVLTNIARDLGCYEDEVVVRVVADVLPDNGIKPDVDWGRTGLVDTFHCVPADNLS